MRLLTLAALALGLALAASAGAIVENFRLSAKIAEQASAHDKAMATAAKAYIAERQRLQDLADALVVSISKADEHYTQELSREQSKTNNLRDAVDAGNKRLLILTKRPASCVYLPAPTGDASVGDGVATELSRDAERDYFHFRRAIEKAQAQLEFLQEAQRSLQAAHPR